MIVTTFIKQSTEYIQQIEAEIQQQQQQLRDQVQATIQSEEELQGEEQQAPRKRAAKKSAGKKTASKKVAAKNAGVPEHLKLMHKVQWRSFELIRLADEIAGALGWS